MNVTSIFIINLATDADRWKRISEALPAARLHTQIQRIAGILGSDVPLVARQILTKSEGWARRAGDVGCFMSHMKAWEAATKASGWSMILEDDAAPVGFERLDDFALPLDADVVFINERMSPGARSETATDITAIPIGDSLAHLNKTGRGVGGDGYLISARAAETLLQAVASDGLFGHVDWRLLRYCVSEDFVASHFSDTRVGGVLKLDVHPQHPPRWGILKAYGVNQPLVCHAPPGNSSSRTAQNIQS